MRIVTGDIDVHVKYVPSLGKQCPGIKVPGVYMKVEVNEEVETAQNSSTKV